MSLFGKNSNKAIMKQVMSQAKRTTVRCPRCGRVFNIVSLGVNDTARCQCGYNVSSRDRA